MNSLNRATIRLAHPMAFVAYLRDLGANAGAYFRRSTLPRLCDDPHAMVTLDSAWNLFADAARREDPDFGWFVGHRIGDQQLNLALLRSLEGEPSLYTALKSFIARISSESSQLSLRLVEREHEVLLCTSYADRRGMPGYHASQGYQLEAYIDLVRHFLGKDWSPRLIGVEAETLGSVVLERHQSSNVLLLRNCGFVSIPRSALSCSLRYKHLELDPPAELAKVDHLDYADTVRQLIRPYLPERKVCANFAADLMGVSLRTQSRYLQRCGTSFQRILDEIRLEIARELLSEESIPIGVIAAETGFDDQAHFTRMFRRLTGVTAREYRKFEAMRPRAGTSAGSHRGEDRLAPGRVGRDHPSSRQTTR